MKFLREQWWDLTGLLTLISTVCLIFTYSLLSSYHVLLWFSLIGLLLHQIEECRIVGTFSGIVNKRRFKDENVNYHFPKRCMLKEKNY